MNIDVIENVLQEILNEQKDTRKSYNQIVSKIEKSASELENFKTEFKISRNVDIMDDSKVLKIVSEKIENIKQLVLTQQKNVAPEKRIIIFPEFKSPECYRLLFNCIIYLIVATYSFLIIRIIIQHWCR